VSKQQSLFASGAERLAFKVLRFVSPKLPRPGYILLGRVLHFFTIPFFAKSVDGAMRVRVAFVHDDKVFVIKNLYSNGKWALPGGGVEHHETDAQGLVREVREELGYDLKLSDLKGVKTYDYESKLWGSTIPCRVFVVQVSKKPVFRMNEWELVGSEWISIDELPRTSEFAKIS
jgi:8-oxo-dGTP pyrophosphatase MutT (NUDIX family)